MSEVKQIVPQVGKTYLLSDNTLFTVARIEGTLMYDANNQVCAPDIIIMEDNQDDLTLNAPIIMSPPVKVSEPAKNTKAENFKKLSEEVQQKMNSNSLGRRIDDKPIVRQEPTNDVINHNTAVIELFKLALAALKQKNNG